MPVARLTTSAISSAPTWVRSSLVLARRRLPASLAWASLSCVSSSGSLPYCSSATLLKSPLRLQLLDLRLRRLSTSLRTCWLSPGRWPFRAFQISSRSAYSLLQLVDLFLDQRQALLRGLVLFLLHGFALDLQLDHAAVELVHDLGLGVDLDLDLAPPPRRSGRWPCRAGSGR